MQTKKKSSKRVEKAKRIFLYILVILIAFLVYFEMNVKGQLKNVVINQVKSLSNEAINLAVDEYLENNKTEIENLLKITSNENKDVKSISSNTYIINKAKTKISTLSKEKIESEMENKGVYFNLGSFTGLVSFSEVGPPIYFRTTAKTNVYCEFQSTFESVGINQTLHHIILTVYVDFDINNPFTIDTFTTNTSYEIAQTVIVGSIPSYYGNGYRY